MRVRSQFILTILTVIVVLVIALVCGGQRTLVTASATPVNVPGPSQFYLQHNLLSDGFVPADHIDSNVVNAWGLVSGPTTPWWVANNGTGTTTLFNVGTG